MLKNDNFSKCTIWSTDQEFFYLIEKLCSVLKIFKYCIYNHLMTYHISDVMMSISTWDKVHFWIYLLNHNSWSHQTWPVDRYQQDQSFPVILWTILRTGTRFRVLFNLLNNQICQDFCFYSFEKLNKWQLKKAYVSH